MAAEVVTVSIEDFAEALIAREFTALDRCDSCAAQARGGALMLAGELLFCGHHLNKHKDAVEAQGGIVWLAQKSAASGTAVGVANEQSV